MKRVKKVRTQPECDNLEVFGHLSVLMEPTMQHLLTNDEGVYVDGTLGGGGHSEEILRRTSARLIGIDRDDDALMAASARLNPFGERFLALKGNYADMDSLLAQAGIEGVQGVLMDLGVSSFQLDAPQRGFSYHNQAPLDMRMDQQQALSARTVVNTYSERELADILWNYGEERWAKRIASFIVKARPVETTGELVEIIRAAIPAAARQDGPHPARRTFQALRIEVNAELTKLPEALDAAVKLLVPGARLCVITFHSLEDRIVKQAMRRYANPCTCPPKMPACVCGKTPLVKLIHPGGIVADEAELEANPRSRSARLRVAQKL